MATFTIPPAVDLFAVLLEGEAHGAFRGLTVGPGGGGRDTPFVLKALAQLFVVSSNMLAERMSSG